MTNVHIGDEVVAPKTKLCGFVFYKSEDEHVAYVKPYNDDYDSEWIDYDDLEPATVEKLCEVFEIDPDLSSMFVGDGA